MSGAPLAWYAARAAGLAAFGLLTLGVWLGLAMSTRLLGGRRQATLLAWHDALAWMGLSALSLHVAALLVDPVVRFDLPAVLLPGASTWHPAAVAAGIVAGWLALALAVSFRFRRRIGRRAWRRLHYASFAAFGLALVHALTAGTDLAGSGGPILALLAAGPVLWLTLARVLLGRRTGRGRAQPAGSGS
jgi:DMSO/TMAO reductase YedYZ heme-binding membrane subunit